MPRRAIHGRQHIIRRFLAREGKFLWSENRRYYRLATIPLLLDRFGIVVGKIINESIDRLFDPDPVFVSQRTAIHVELSQSKPADRDFVVVGRQRFGFKKLLSLARCFVGIPGEHSLVKGFLRRQCRLVAEKHLEKL